MGCSSLKEMYEDICSQDRNSVLKPDLKEDFRAKHCCDNTNKGGHLRCSSGPLLHIPQTTFPSQNNLAKKR